MPKWNYGIRKFLSMELAFFKTFMLYSIIRNDRNIFLKLVSYKIWRMLKSALCFFRNYEYEIKSICRRHSKHTTPPSRRSATHKPRSCVQYLPCTSSRAHFSTPKRRFQTKVHQLLVIPC